MYEFKVTGMSCGGCVNSVTNALKNEDPNAKVSVDLGAQLVRVESDKEETQISAAIEDAGYTVVNAKKVI